MPAGIEFVNLLPERLAGQLIPVVLARIDEDLRENPSKAALYSAIGVVETDRYRVVMELSSRVEEREFEGEEALMNRIRSMLKEMLSESADIRGLRVKRILEEVKVVKLDPSKRFHSVISALLLL